MLKLFVVVFWIAVAAIAAVTWPLPVALFALAGGVIALAWRDLQKNGLM